ncbi:hypothetical protein G7046_g4669 [Stylonectria norvegica]|nr:hypothetical protein G7046_g4669 [Stylonectria norvegica]
MAAAPRDTNTYRIRRCIAFIVVAIRPEPIQGTQLHRGRERARWRRRLPGPCGSSAGARFYRDGILLGGCIAEEKRVMSGRYVRLRWKPEVAVGMDAITTSSRSRRLDDDNDGDSSRPPIEELPSIANKHPQPHPRSCSRSRSRSPSASPSHTHHPPRDRVSANGFLASRSLLCPSTTDPIQASCRMNSSRASTPIVHRVKVLTLTLCTRSTVVHFPILRDPLSHSASLASLVSAAIYDLEAG